MSKHKIIIIEDDTKLGKSIESILLKNGYSVTSIVTTGTIALAEIEQSSPSLAVIDTSLCGDMNAIDTAIAIRDKFEIPVIFISAEASENLINSAKQAEPYGFLLKPLKELELNAAIVTAIYRHSVNMQIKKEKELYQSIVGNRNTAESIFVRADFRLNRIKFEHINYVEAQKDYVTIYTGNNKFTTHATMKEMMRMLPESDFKRIHRSYIVRLDKIFTIKYPDLVIEGNMRTIPIGGLYRKNLYNSLNTI